MGLWFLKINRLTQNMSLRLICLPWLSLSQHQQIPGETWFFNEVKFLFKRKKLCWNVLIVLHKWEWKTLLLLEKVTSIKMTQTLYQVTRFQFDYVLIRESGAEPQTLCPSAITRLQAGLSQKWHKCCSGGLQWPHLTAFVLRFFIFFTWWCCVGKFSDSWKPRQIWSLRWTWGCHLHTASMAQ